MTLLNLFQKAAHKSIFRKVFVSTLFLMACCFLVEMIFQMSLISVLYQRSNIKAASDTLKDAVNSAESYLKAHSDDTSLEKAFDSASYPFIVLDESGKLIAFPYSEDLTSLNVRTSDGMLYIIFNPTDYPTLSFYNLISNHTLSSYSVRLWDTNYALPLSFSYNGYSYSNNANLTQWRKGYPNSFCLSEHVTGRLTSISNYFTTTSEKHRVSMAVFSSLAWDSLSGATCAELCEKYTAQEPVAGEYAILSKTLHCNDKNYYFFTAKYIDDLSLSYSLLQRYNLILYLIFLIVIAAVSFFHSRSITSPLIYLSNQANRIASLDFTEVIKLDTDDELGNLAKSLNSISTNMNTTLSELNQINSKLRDESQQRYESEQRIRNLLTEMSHEFKTPLNIISSAGSILRDGLCEKDSSYYMDTIVEQSTKLSSMVNDVITLSHLESGYYFFDPKRFKIVSLINKVVLTYEASVAEPHRTIVPRNLSFWVYADPDRIEQVLMNFISNASRYSPPGSSIRINVSKQDDDNIYIEIINSGSLCVDDPHRVWEQFYHKSNGHTRTPESGSGIGLTICAKILDLHKSNYGVFEKNNEVHFYFTLPSA